MPVKDLKIGEEMKAFNVKPPKSITGIKTYKTFKDYFKDVKNDLDKTHKKHLDVMHQALGS